MLELYEKVVERFLNVGSKQFLKDFKRNFLVKKPLAHRQMVLIRKNKEERKKAKIAIREFQNDISRNKCESHSRLKSLLRGFGNAYLWKVYTVPELTKLCDAYGVTNKRGKKAEFGARLAEVIMG